ncbi:MAG: DUF2306 domain-containing protein [Pseudomonadota bacterium]|nr:DUF2306 domain-containing protein [Pseudomonadota bacterium]
MKYQDLMYWHLSTVLPAALLGGLLLAFAKGTPVHRLLGKIYMMLMLLTAIITLFMSAEVGPTLLNHFGFIHLLSLLVLITVPRAYIAAKNHDVTSHKYSMLSMYIGAVLIAGSFTLMPGRYLHGVLVG